MRTKIVLPIAVSGFLITIAFTSKASAYVGPGAGSGALASLIGGILWLGLLIVGSIWYPIRAAIHKVRKKLGNL